MTSGRRRHFAFPRNAIGARLDIIRLVLSFLAVVTGIKTVGGSVALLSRTFSGFRPHNTRTTTSKQS